MVALVAAAAFAIPWVHPLSFAPLAGWNTGASGNVPTRYSGDRSYALHAKQSSAWIATGVRYRDPPTADPPNTTLAHMPRRAIVVWAVIYQERRPSKPPIRLRIERAKHFPCCEGEYVAGGEYELAGSGPARTYSVIVRIYFGAPPTRAMRTRAQAALDRLRLPAPRAS